MKIKEEDKVKIETYINLGFSEKDSKLIVKWMANNETINPETSEIKCPEFFVPYKNKEGVAFVHPECFVPVPTDQDFVRNFKSKKSVQRLLAE